MFYLVGKQEPIQNRFQVEAVGDGEGDHFRHFSAPPTVGLIHESRYGHRSRPARPSGSPAAARSPRTGEVRCSLFGYLHVPSEVLQLGVELVPNQLRALRKRRLIDVALPCLGVGDPAEEVPIRDDL